MKKHILLLSFFLFTTLGFTQVGVNTSSPHPSSMLDISATDKGVLVPRVSLNNVTTTMLDGTNTAATGLLIWNTNAATTGGNGIGFYFFNGTQWMPITQIITDDQTIDNFSLSGTTLRLSLENDGQPLQTVNLTSLVGTDDQNLTTPTLTGTTLNLGIESGTGTSIDLAPLQDGTGTDDQIVDNFSLSGTTLRLSLENDGQPLQTVNLSSLQDGTGTDDQNLTTPTLTGTTLNLGIESDTGTSIDLAPLQDGTGTDDQIVDNFSLSGTTLRLSLENDGQPLQTVNLSSLQDGTGTDDQNLTTPTLTGTTLNLGIESGTGTSIDLAPLQDGTGTDDQIVDNFSLSGTTLRLSLENDGLPLQTVNLATLDTQNTLDQAYNEGGAGAGRIINANNGAVEINANNPNSSGLIVTQTVGSGTKMYAGTFTATSGFPTAEPTAIKAIATGKLGDVIAVDASIGNSTSPLPPTAIINNYGIKSSVSDSNLTSSLTSNYGVYSSVSGGDKNYGILSYTTGSALLIDNWAGYFGNPAALATHLSGNVYVKDFLQVDRGLIYKPNGLATTVGNILQYVDTNGLLDAVAPSTIFTDTQNTLDQAYDEGGPGAGRIITASNGAVLINGNDGFQNTGTFGSGATLALTGADTKMFFYPRKAAFRAGYVNGTQWDDTNIGIYSTAFGNLTSASGQASNAFGYSTSASGNFSTAFGANILASGSISTAFGSSNSAPSYGETVLGIGATTYTPSVNGATQFRTANATDRLFVIGNAIDSNNNSIMDVTERSNALTIYKSGLMNINDAYNMPLTAGTNGQVMTIDGAGNVTFQNPNSGTDDQNIQNLAFNTLTNVLTVGIENGTSQTVNLSALDTGGDILGVTAGDGLTGGGLTGSVTLTAAANNGLNVDTAADNIQLGGPLVENTEISQGIYSMDINLNSTGDFAIQDNGTDVFFVEDTGDIGIGISDPAYPLHIYENDNTKLNALYINKIDNTTSETSGLFIKKTGNGDGRSHAIFTDVDGTSTGQKYGIFNRLTSTAAGNQYGTRNFISGASPSNQFGTFNNLDNAGTANHYGVYNGMRGTAAANLYATYNEFDNVTTAANLYGTYTNFSVNATGTGSKYGSYTSIDTSLGGTHYGTYNDVGVANGWAGYFLGNSYFSNSVGIGTTTPDYNLSVSGTLNLREDIATGGAALRVNGSEAIWFDGNQFSWGFGGTVNFFSDDVGIGINAPAYKLDVRDTNAGDYIAQIYNTSTNANADGLKIRVGNASIPTSSTSYVAFFDGGNNVRGRIEGNGTGVTYNTTSDGRLKTNINNIDNALNLIDKIQPRIYEYKSNLGTEEYGFIAQELQPLYPQAVSGTPDSDVETNPMMVDYSRLTPLLTAGIKELKEEVNLLKSENEKLKAQLTKYEQLEARLSDLENNTKKGSDLILVSKN